MPTRTLKLGTRASALAMAQSGEIAKQLEAKHDGLKVELVTITSTGDAKQDTAFGAVGSVGMFVKELEAALLDKRVDFAVHSLKDLPTAITDGLAIHAVPLRATPYDVLVAPDDMILDMLDDGAKIGTGSPRRKAQILAYRDDVNVVAIRGNIDTRLKRLDDGRYDAIVLAAAGLERLGLEERATEIFTPDIMVPAVGQGCLALEGRADDERTRELLKALDDPLSHHEAIAERSLLAALGGGCHEPIAALARSAGSELRLIGLVSSPDGLTVLRAEETGPERAPEKLGEKLAERLIEMGAARVLGLPASGAS